MSSSIYVAFSCKKCNNLLFPKVVDFIEHKKENHFIEFKDTKCIIFEEKATTSASDDYNEYSYKSDPLDAPAPVSVKIEAEENIELAKNHIEIRNDLDPCCILSSSKDGIPTPLQFKTEHLNPDYPDTNEASTIPIFSEQIHLEAGSAVHDLHRSFHTDESATASLIDAGADFQNAQDCDTKAEFLDVKLGPENVSLAFKPTGKVVIFENSSYDVVPPTSIRVIHTPTPVPFVQELIVQTPTLNKIDIGKEGFRISNNIFEDNTSVRKSASEKFKCQICSKEFSLRASLQRHSESHKKREDQCRQFKCQFCGKSFMLSHHLKDHVRRHSTDKLYKCLEPNCNKAFKTLSNLRSHFTVHSAWRRFTCSMPNCDKSYKHKVDLNLHLETHAVGGERNYKCSEDNCSKDFATITHLNRHRRRAHNYAASATIL